MFISFFGVRSITRNLSTCSNSCIHRVSNPYLVTKGYGSGYPLDYNFRNYMYICCICISYTVFGAN